MSTNYFKRIPKVRNVEKNSFERNFSVVPISSLKDFLRHPVNYTVLSEAFIGRFDLVSASLYGTTAYDWAIMSVNDIINPFDEGLVGRTIMYPDVLDITEFLSRSSFERNRI